MALGLYAMVYVDARAVCARVCEEALIYIEMGDERKRNRKVGVKHPQKKKRASYAAGAAAASEGRAE